MICFKNWLRIKESEGDCCRYMIRIFKCVEIKKAWHEVVVMRCWYLWSMRPLILFASLVIVCLPISYGYIWNSDTIALVIVCYIDIESELSHWYIRFCLISCCFEKLKSASLFVSFDCLVPVRLSLTGIQLKFSWGGCVLAVMPTAMWPTKIKGH